MDIEKLWENLAPKLVNGGLRLLAAILVIIVGWILVKWIEKLIRKSKLFGKMDVTAKSFLVSVLSVILKIVVILTAVANLGVNMTGLVTLLGSCGLAIGLALQGSLSNFAGGVLILIFRPFRVGDYIEVGGSAGMVKSISILYTTLTTVDNKDIVMPNGNLSNNTVINYSAEDLRRVDIDCNVAFGTDSEKVKETLLKIAEEHDLVLDKPVPFARLTATGDSALIFTLRVWVKKEDYWDVRFDLLEQIKAAFEKNGIVVPFPQMDVHMNP